MNETTPLRRKPSVLAADIGEDCVLLNDDLQYLGLNATGREIWSLLEQQRTVGELISELLAKYEVNETDCRAAVRAYLEQLREHQVIDIT